MQENVCFSFSFFLLFWWSFCAGLVLNISLILVHIQKFLSCDLEEYLLYLCQSDLISSMILALFLFFTDKNVKKLMGQIHFQLIIK